jgi:hypothetical protein
MNLQEKLKISSMIIDKKSYNAIKLDFKQKFIATTNGKILLKINHDFDVNKKDSEFFKDKEGFIFNATFLDELIKHIDIGHNIFEVLEKHFNTYEYSNYFPNIDAINFSYMQAVSSIAYNTKTVLSVIKVCEKLKMQNISFNFNSEKNPTQIKNDVAEIIFMPYV